jgi:nucleotide-binding universal stress UspA family protein
MERSYMMYKRILVPLDGSKFAETSLDHVRVLAKGCPVDRVILLRVIEPIIADVKDYIGAERVREAEAKLEAEAKKYLDRIASELKKDNIPAESKLVVDGEPAAKILETIKEEKINLIIMSTHGRTGFEKWLHGSVAQKVMAHTSIPILMVVPKGSKAKKG